MTLTRVLRPLPRTVTRPAAVLIMLAWVLQMTTLVRAAYLENPTLAADLSRYGSGAQWKGVYYRGEKIGFMVGQSQATEDGYELSEDGRLQMMLLGATTAARIHTSARVDRAFNLRSFAFSLDPGTGPMEISGTLRGRSLELTVKSPSGSTRTEARELAEPPSLALNLPRQLAAAGLAPGMKRTLSAFDPATMRNAPMELSVEGREVIWAANKPVPAFRVKATFQGLASTSWITDVGEVVREESPMGLIVLRETRERATALAVPGNVQVDMLRAAAIPASGPRIVDGTQLESLRIRVTGFRLEPAETSGAGQTVSGDVVEIVDSASQRPAPAGGEVVRARQPEPLIESDAPEIVAEAAKAVGDAGSAQAKAERLTRYVAAFLEKKPTVSLPSALEVLRTRVGDCNEHTALFVAMARAAGLPARVAVGVVHIHGAFYFHAWPEVFIEAAAGRGHWLAVDPTLNQFPADPTHVVLARGGLDRQAAILPALGQARIEILSMKRRAGVSNILVGRAARDVRPIDIPLPRRGSGAGCWSRPPE
ncbi:MAG TPA: transglutaminase-like domain-containing protein [Vicinamibacteria bacterium]|nr:transglutaminase-like domain-containing protein [Vicinamibacteria bacterium]